MKNKKPILYIVVPCYNEEKGIKKNSKILLNKLVELENNSIISNASKIIFVNDGSKDKTKEIVNKLAGENDKFGVVSFVSNAGHQNAVYAGMMASKEYADIVITIDADLQQDVNAMEKFIESYNNGNDVVYGVRNDRNTDGAFKKLTAGLFYSMMKLFGSNILADSSDYRLLSKRALESLSNYKEGNLFLRGLIPCMGFNSDIVHFDVKDREDGESKYTFKKMLNLAISGITSFSVTPMHMICVAGAVCVAISLLILIINLFGLLFTKPFTDLAIMLFVTFFLFGIAIGSIGIIGEYVGTINQEVKNRPRYIIDYVLIKTKDKNEKESRK